MRNTMDWGTIATSTRARKEQISRARALLRLRARRAAGTVGVGFLALAMAACAPSVANEYVPDGSAPIEAPVTTEVSPTLEPAPSPERITLSADYADADGYTSELIGFVAPLAFEADIQNAAPGFTDLITPLDIAAVLKNTTAGRAASPFVNISVVAGYDEGSAVCQLDEATAESAAPELVQPESGPRCYLPLALYTQQADLAPDGEATLSPAISAYDFISSVHYTLPGVPESIAPDVMAALNAPLGYGFLVSNNIDTLDADTWTASCRTAPTWIGGGTTFVAEIVGLSSPEVCA